MCLTAHILAAVLDAVVLESFLLGSFRNYVTLWGEGRRSRCDSAKVRPASHTLSTSHDACHSGAYAG